MGVAVGEGVVDGVGEGLGVGVGKTHGGYDAGALVETAWVELAGSCSVGRSARALGGSEFVGSSATVGATGTASAIATAATATLITQCTGRAFGKTFPLWEQ